MGGVTGIARRIGHRNRNAMVTFPSAPMTDAGTPTLQLPFACTTPVKLWPPTVTVTTSPAAAPVALAGNNLRLALLTGVENIVARDGIDGHDRGDSIHGEMRRVDDPFPALSLTFTVRVCSPFASDCTSLAGSVTDRYRRCPPWRYGFTVHCHRDNLTGFRRGFPAQRQRLMVFSGIDNIVLRDSIDRDGRCRSIHANRLTAVHGIARRVLAADVHRPCRRPAPAHPPQAPSRSMRRLHPPQPYRICRSA